MNKRKQYIYGFCLIVLLFTVSFTISAQDAYRLAGIINDADEGKPVELATVRCTGINRVTFSDADGYFMFTELSAGEHTLEISFIGYKKAVVVLALAGDTVVSVEVERENLQVKEVVVTALEKERGATASVIDGMAIQQLQPSGFADLLELLPGHISPAKQDMSGVSHMVLRQAGSDGNTAFGTSFVVDGIPLSNDGNLQYVTNGSSDLKISGREAVPGGIDMRQLSTDDIERVEIIRGVPSARHGDVSSGVVLIERKWGRTPLTLRVKADLNNKLASLNKGIRLPGSKGIVNLGAEILSYINDPRNPLENYTRSTFSLKYIRHFDVRGNEVILKAGGSYLLTLDKEKADPELNYGLRDYYKSDYSRYGIDLSGDLYMKGRGAGKLSVKLSAVRVIDKLTRERYVAPTGPMPQPTAMEEGKHDAAYLAQGYDAALVVDGKPLNLFAQLDYSMMHRGDIFSHNISAGIEWKFDKNYGKGEIYDLSRPLFPATSSVRPRPFGDIPALEKLSGYVEDEMRIRVGKHQLYLQAGLRASTLISIDGGYAMHGRIYTDPRVNIRWTLPAFRVGEDRRATVALRAARGRLMRMPTSVHLYPAPRYYDIIELNYYSQNPDLRRLYVMTSIVDPVNYDLLPAENVKEEAGIDLSIGGTKVAVTLFDEKMSNGLLNSTTYLSLTHNAYEASSVSPEGLTAPPDLSLFDYVEKTRLYAMSKWTNGALLHKKGIEYMVAFPRIDKLGTRITIDGAWFKTSYGTTLPVYSKPSYVINQEPYPYAGVYESDAAKNSEKQLLNTNIQFDVNVPDFRLLFSVSIQTMWFEKARQMPFHGIPTGYIDQYGMYHEYTADDRDDPILSYLVKTYSDRYFDTETVPVDSRVNLKVSKELGDIMKFAFYVNRIARYAPDYRNKYNTTVHRSSSPYFGMEVKFNL